ncbi:hypothetical protein FHS87_004113 [Roseomonas pecuniae]|uniref:Uncharacterized protein n=1 Tax=Muricoccus pecuniae TaxID=693023 RepID=A0A840Y5M7_9PROT|nr:hypothetical protein [Roseomonas pecuniae]
MGMGADTEESGARLHAILAAAKRRPAGGTRKAHSPLYEWMWAHASDLVAELNPPRTPNWQAIAEEFQRAQVTDGQGRPPTAERVRKTWWKVRADRRAQEGGEAVRQAPRRAVLPPPVQETPAPQPAEASSEHEPASPRFGFAKPRT